MQLLLAHVTQNEMPAFWVAGLIGFVAGVIVSFAVFALKTR